MDKYYRVIHADPPWPFTSRAPCMYGRGNFYDIRNKYPIMKLQDIKTLPVNKISLPDSALFLWTTDTHMPFALQVIASWGFRYSTVAFVWVKKNPSGKVRSNVGPWVMKNCELCLLGTRGKMLSLKINNNVKQLIEAPVSGHSVKPEEARKRIELLFPGPYIELFARKKSLGWDSWGDEVENDIDLIRSDVK